jgi:hypothetical protein
MTEKIKYVLIRFFAELTNALRSDKDDNEFIRILREASYQIEILFEEKEESEWISVDDSLPEANLEVNDLINVSTDVLIVDKTYGLQIGWLKKFKRDSESTGVKKDEWLFENFHFRMCNVVCWKPLPKVPEKYDKQCNKTLFARS